MFKRRSVPLKGSAQNKRKKVEVREETTENDNLDNTQRGKDVAVTKQRDMMGLLHDTTIKAKSFNDSNGDQTMKENRKCESMLSLSNDDEETREGTLNADNNHLEKKGSTSGRETALSSNSLLPQSKKQIRQPSNLRATMITDYQPDICKDYQKTGYCGYGDSCKFLHIREDFKGNWTVKKDWVFSGKDTKKLYGSRKTISDASSKCPICYEDCKSPVMTACGHCFCSKCFSKRVREDPRCPVCRSDTQGVAKVAKVANISNTCIAQKNKT